MMRGGKRGGGQWEYYSFDQGGPEFGGGGGGGYSAYYHHNHNNRGGRGRGGVNRKQNRLCYINAEFLSNNNNQNNAGVVQGQGQGQGQNGKGNEMQQQTGNGGGASGGWRRAGSARGAAPGNGFPDRPHTFAPASSSNAVGSSSSRNSPLIIEDISVTFPGQGQRRRSKEKERRRSGTRGGGNNGRESREGSASARRERDEEGDGKGSRKKRKRSRSKSPLEEESSRRVHHKRHKKAKKHKRQGDEEQPEGLEDVSSGSVCALDVDDQHEINPCPLNDSGDLRCILVRHRLRIKREPGEIVDSDEESQHTVRPNSSSSNKAKEKEKEKELERRSHNGRRDKERERRKEKSRERQGQQVRDRSRSRSSRIREAPPRPRPESEIRPSFPKSPIVDRPSRRGGGSSRRTIDDGNHDPIRLPGARPPSTESLSDSPSTVGNEENDGFDGNPLNIIKHMQDDKLAFAMQCQDRLYAEVEKMKASFEIEILKLQEYYEARLAFYRNQGAYPGPFLPANAAGSGSGSGGGSGPNGGSANTFPKVSIMTPMEMNMLFTGQQVQTNGINGHGQGDNRSSSAQVGAGILPHPHHLAAGIIQGAEAFGPTMMRFPGGFSRARVPMFLNPMMRRPHELQGIPVSTNGSGTNLPSATSTGTGVSNINNGSNTNNNTLNQNQNSSSINNDGSSGNSNNFSSSFSR